MSQLDSNLADPEAPRGVLVRKPRTNIYTVMLIIAFVAMCLACLFLYLEKLEYSSDQAAQRTGPSPSAVVLVDAADVRVV